MEEGPKPKAPRKAKCSDLRSLFFLEGKKGVKYRGIVFFGGGFRAGLSTLLGFVFHPMIFGHV